MSAPRIAADLQMGAVHLTVADLSRSLAFYERALGLQVRERDASAASLGADGHDLIVLYEQQGARPVAGHTGLFHFALLVPDRADLARWLRHAATTRVPLSGMADHAVSEAIYLRDPDHHGIEIYRDRPRSEWPIGEDGRIGIVTLPLDADDLLGSLGDGTPDFERMPAGTIMGHIHLHVADIPATEEFYDGTLGLDVVARYGEEATFMSAGGYHHHLAGNVWAGRGATPPPPGSAALRSATILLPDTDERDRLAGQVADSGQEPESAPGGVLVRDPAGNPLLLAVSSS